MLLRADFVPLSIIKQLLSVFIIPLFSAKRKRFTLLFYIFMRKESLIRGQVTAFFNEFDKDFRRYARIVERAVVIERKAVIIRHGIEFIIRQFPT